MSAAEQSKQEDVKTKASQLLDTVQDLNSKGYRLVQACAANAEKELEVWYSFDKGDYILRNLIVSVPKNNSLQSITNIYWYAFIYENEMNDLFGIKFKNSKLDYEGHFFRISEKTPWNPDDRKGGE